MSAEKCLYTSECMTNVEKFSARTYYQNKYFNV